MATPLEIVGNQLILLEAEVAGRAARMALDTGAGIDLLSASLARELGLAATGAFTGERMTGEEITCDLVSGPPLRVGGFEHTPDVVGVHGLFDNLPPQLGRVDGAVSLRFFAEQPFTIDYAASQLRLGALAGDSVPMQLQQEGGLAMSGFVTARLDDRLDGRFLVDTGASLSVVEMKTMERLDVLHGDVHEGTNETGWRYHRIVAPIESLAVGRTVHERPKICFESIRHDGVIGNDFLKRASVGFDVAACRMALAAV